MANAYMKGYIETLRKCVRDLVEENARLRQQLDAANAQLDFLIEEMKKAREGP